MKAVTMRVFLLFTLASLVIYFWKEHKKTTIHNVILSKTVGPLAAERCQLFSHETDRLCCTLFTRSTIVKS